MDAARVPVRRGAGVPGGGEPRYHGAEVFGLENGRLELDPDWAYWVHYHYPQPVILDNAGEDHPHRSEHRQAERVVELEGEGWPWVPLHLRVVDPPDMAPYAPDGGWPVSGDPAAAVPPYEGNDDSGYADTDQGLSSGATGPWSRELDVTPGSDGTYRVYLKVPARYWCGSAGRRARLLGGRTRKPVTCFFDTWRKTLLMSPSPGTFLAGKTVCLMRVSSRGSGCQRPLAAATHGSSLLWSPTLTSGSRTRSG
jgi:hypothetical protein